MKALGFMLLLLGSIVFPAMSNAAGLPANPWQNKTLLNSTTETQNQVENAQKTVADMWSKVRSTEEFRQWSMPAQSSAASIKNADDEEQNLLNMLEKLNQVGYFIPSDYKTIVKRLPAAQKKSTSMRASYTDVYEKYSNSYNDFIRDWQAKYHKTKENSFNILGNSYRRTLNTLKQATGIDVNRAINDS